MLPGELLEEVDEPGVDSGATGDGGRDTGDGGRGTDGEGPSVVGGEEAESDGDEPQGRRRGGQRRSGSRRAAGTPEAKREARVEPERPDRPAPRRRRSGAPTRSNPTFFDALPGPSTSASIPNFVIRKFRVPIFLLPIYQAAGIQYGIRWEYLAAINEIETDYGRNLNVSSAGALGWMQFMPATWRAYGVDANRDGRKDPYNPVDAIFAARPLPEGGRRAR